jgi:hypothetical protein
VKQPGEDRDDREEIAKLEKPDQDRELLLVAELGELALVVVQSKVSHM